MMVNGESRAERPAGIAGRGLDPDGVIEAERWILPFPTQFNATPPAMQRFFMPVSASHAARS
jgi:hypothetical protein